MIANAQSAWNHSRKERKNWQFSVVHMFSINFASKAANKPLHKRDAHCAGMIITNK